MVGEIKGTGSYSPEKVVSNNDLAMTVDTSDQWIQERTGVINRHIIEIEAETTVSMAAEAARRALDNANISADNIDLIIVATISSDVVMPNAACMVQKEIGASNAVCFDLNAACSGFIFAYHTAQAYIATGVVEHALVIGAESLSQLVDWQDRSTCILFGDGAGAVVLSATDGKVHPMVMHAMGEKGQALTCDTLHAGEEVGAKHYIHMDGQEIFKFAVRTVPKVIEELLDKVEIGIEEIDYCILHQANKRIVEAVSKRLGIPMERCPMNLMEYGNTSSASVPILLDELNRTGQLKTGDRLVMAGFGAGLTWGAAYLEWNC